MAEGSYTTSSDTAWLTFNKIRIPEFPELSDFLLTAENLKTLLRRADYRVGQAAWTIFRVSKSKGGFKVAWRRFAPRMEVTTVPAKLGDQHIIPITTLYFLSMEDEDQAYALAGLLNSTIGRAWVVT